MNYDYTTFGHVTVDVLEDGREQVGGGAFYSALQASALGLRTRIVTRGERREVERLLSPFAGRFELEVQSAARTTRLETIGTGTTRRQRVAAWAGELAAVPRIDSAIVHLAPVARETQFDWPEGSRFRGLTPQGLLRSWDRDGAVEPAQLEASSLGLADRLDAAVLTVQEQPLCEQFIARAVACGAIVSVTDEGRENVVLDADGAERVAPEPLVEVRQDLGGGDVYAAAFFASLASGANSRTAAVRANRAARWHLSCDQPAGVIAAELLD